MRFSLTFMPILALTSSVIAAPTPKCGWKHHSKPDITEPISEPARINHRAAPVIEATIADPVDVVTRGIPLPLSWKKILGPGVIDC